MNASEPAGVMRSFSSLLRAIKYSESINTRGYLPVILLRLAFLRNANVKKIQHNFQRLADVALQ